MVTSATQSGNYTVVIRATDNCGLVTEASLALHVTCPTLTISPSTLPNGVQGAAYNQTLTGAPSGTAYTFAVSMGSLPPGLTLASNGRLSGTPTAGGSYAFGITVTGFGGCTGTKSYNLLISGTCATLTVTTATLPGGSMNTNYEQTINVTGGIAPYSFAITSGALPRGLSLNASTGNPNTGVITGVPTQGGTFSFRVTATGQGGCTGSRQYMVTIGCSPLSFTPTTLPNATCNSSYSQTLSVSPAGTYTFSLLIGSLPPGFMLSSAGVLSGMTNQAGTFNFTVKALGNTCQGTKVYTLVISSGAAALAQLADYDGDGKSDAALWSATDSNWRIVRSSNQQTENTPWGTAGNVALLGDYDGDG
jgi:large repetitive protein